VDKHPPPSTTHRHSPIHCGRSSGNSASIPRTPHSTSRPGSRRKTDGPPHSLRACWKSIAASSSSPCVPDIRSRRPMPSTRRGTCTCSTPNRIGANSARRCSASHFTTVRAKAARRKTGSSPTGTNTRSIVTRASSASTRPPISGRPWRFASRARSVINAFASMMRGSSRSRVCLEAERLSPQLASLPFRSCSLRPTTTILQSRGSS